MKMENKSGGKYNINKKAVKFVLPLFLYPEPGSNRHSRRNWCLRPARLPIPPSGHYFAKVIFFIEVANVFLLYFFTITTLYFYHVNIHKNEPLLINSNNLISSLNRKSLRFEYINRLMLSRYIR